MILFDLLIRLYPREFRRTFGAEMREVFADQHRVARADGWRAQAAL